MFRCLVIIVDENKVYINELMAHGINSAAVITAEFNC